MRGSKKPDKRRSAKQQEKVAALRKSGPLSPNKKGRVSVSFGIENGKMVTRHPDGKIEREK